MLVQQILKSKGSDKVFTVTPETRVSDAVQILAERRIGVLIVSSDGQHIAGILSERDIIRTLALRGTDCLSGQVDQIMTPNPSCCVQSETADQVLQRMTDGRFRHLPVTEADRLVGLVSIGDVVKARLEELAMEKSALEGMIMGH